MNPFRSTYNNLEAVYMRVGRNSKRDETINKVRRLKSIVHKFAVTFTSIPHSRDNISRIKTSTQDEKRPALIFPEMCTNCKTRSCLFKILSFKKQPTRAV